jgi:hypothetical protein
VITPRSPPRRRRRSSVDGVRAGKWRILVGDDAQALDEAVRADPEGAYGERGLSLDTITGQ